MVYRYLTDSDLRDRERLEQRRQFWSVRSSVFAVLEVILVMFLLVLGVTFRMPMMALALAMAGTLTLIVLYRMRPLPEEG